VALTTYITSTEATSGYDDALYGVTEKSQALSLSFMLVNSYIDGKLQVPVIAEWNGSDATINAPGALKLAQIKGYEYLLRRGEVGDTPQVLAVFEAFREFCQSISQNELTLPSATTFESEVGWHIVGKSNTGGGDCFVRGASPSLNQHVKIVITNAATASYPGTFTYTLQEPSRSAANTSTGNATSFNWTNIAALSDLSRPFELRWVGKWTNSDYVEIRGVAADMVDSVPPQRNELQQSRIAY